MNSKGLTWDCELTQADRARVLASASVRRLRIILTLLYLILFVGGWILLIVGKRLSNAEIGDTLVVIGTVLVGFSVVAALTGLVTLVSRLFSSEDPED